MRILIADDHIILRTTLKALLESHAGWEVCGEAADGLEAIEKAAELKPDVIILDLSMPKLDGLQAASQISAAAPNVPILLYTSYAFSPDAKGEAKKYGVREVINKGASPDQLVSALESLQPPKSQASLDEALPDADLPRTDPLGGPEEN